MLGMRTAAAVKSANTGRMDVRSMISTGTTTTVRECLTGITGRMGDVDPVYPSAHIRKDGDQANGGSDEFSGSSRT
jgi:hypothetical protein